MIPAPDYDVVKNALAITQSADVTRVHRYISAATELANAQAPDAPVDVAHEAIIRCVGYLMEYPTVGLLPGDTASLPPVGTPLDQAKASHAGLWRKCGAEGMLARWTVRRAGAI